MFLFCPHSVFWREPRNGADAVLFCVAINTEASFISPMFQLKTEKLPEGENRLYKLKIDGYL
jgi:hypothetical protein